MLSPSCSGGKSTRKKALFVAAWRCCSVKLEKRLSSPPDLWEGSLAVIGVFADQTTDAAQAYLAAAANIDYIPFAITSSAEVAAEHKIEGEAVLLLKTFDDGRAVLAEDIT